MAVSPVLDGSLLGSGGWLGVARGGGFHDSFNSWKRTDWKFPRNTAAREDCKVWSLPRCGARSTAGLGRGSGVGGVAGSRPGWRPGLRWRTNIVRFCRRAEIWVRNHVDLGRKVWITWCEERKLQGLWTRGPEGTATTQALAQA